MLSVFGRVTRGKGTGSEETFQDSDKTGQYCKVAEKIEQEEVRRTCRLM